MYLSYVKQIGFIHVKTPSIYKMAGIGKKQLMLIDHEYAVKFVNAGRWLGN